MIQSASDTSAAELLVALEVPYNVKAPDSQREHLDDRNMGYRDIKLQLNESTAFALLSLISEGSLTVSMQICPFFDKFLQLPQAAKGELFGIRR